MGRLFKRIIVLGACVVGANYAYSNILSDNQRKLINTGAKLGKSVATKGVKLIKKELNKISGEDEITNESNSAWVQQQWSNIGF